MELSSYVMEMYKERYETMIDPLRSREVYGMPPGISSSGPVKKEEEQAAIADSAQISSAGSKKSSKKEEKGAVETSKFSMPPANKGAGIFSESYGKITHWTFQLDGDCAGTPIRDEVLGAWKTVFTTADPDVKFTVVLENQKDKDDVTRMLRENNVRNPERFNLLVQDDINITMWSRDQMVGLFNPTDTTSTLLGQTTMRPHGDDPMVPPRIAAANRDSVIFDPDKRLVTDGGDVVSNDRESFVGYASVYLTAKKLYDLDHGGSSKRGETTPDSFKQKLTMEFPEGGENYHVPDFSFEKNPGYKPTKGFADEEAVYMKKAVELFHEKYGKNITVVGADDPATPEMEVPSTFHIDMGFTPISDSKILVGDPGRALEIIKNLPKEKYDEYNTYLQQTLGAEGDVLQKLVDANTKDDPLLQHQFDYNAEMAAKKGYEVERLPYLQGPPGITWFTYNNCKMETYTREDGTEVKRVFLPTFGIPELDDVAKETYEKNGFTVHALKLPGLTSWRGAIRCISNVLGRSPEV